MRRTLEPAAVTAAKRAPGSRGWRQDVLLAAVVLLLTVPIVQPMMAQQASRYALTAALWDQRTTVIDAYADIISVDYAQRGGRLYSDKAPGQPVLALPAYGLYRVLGGEPGTINRPFGNLGLWAVSVWSAALPAALLAVGMRRLALRVAPRQATKAALAMAVSTMLLPFATVLFSHVLAGLLVLGAYLLLVRRPVTPLALFGAGFLAAVGVTVEYPVALAGLVLFAVAAVQRGWRSAWFLAGGVLPGMALAAYHWVAFGGPLQFPYKFSGFAEFHEAGVVGVRPPRLEMVVEVLYGERGLFLLTPIVLVGLVGAVLLLGRRSRRQHAAVALAVFALFMVVMGGWSNATGGASPGPRYLVPALPLFVVGVAESFRRFPALSWAAVAVGALTMSLATFTLPLAPRNQVGLAYWWQRARSGAWADTLLTLQFGDWALVLPILAAAALATWLVRTDPT